jgi:glutamine amidotransferase
VGWNDLVFKNKDHALLKYINSGDFVYFVHSYYVRGLDEHIVAYTNYQVLIPAIVNYKNIYATQFHPEKSGDVGLNILKAYGEMIK